MKRVPSLAMDGELLFCFFPEKVMGCPPVNTGLTYLETRQCGGLLLYEYYLFSGQPRELIVVSIRELWSDSSLKGRLFSVEVVCTESNVFYVEVFIGIHIRMWFLAWDMTDIKMQLN